MLMACEKELLKIIIDKVINFLASTTCLYDEKTALLEREFTEVW